MLSRPYSKVGRMTLLRICTLVLIWILLWSHRMRDRDWNVNEALQILELIFVSIPKIILNNAAQVLKLTDHFSGLHFWNQVDGCWQDIWTLRWQYCKRLGLLTADGEAQLPAASGEGVQHGGESARRTMSSCTPGESPVSPISGSSACSFTQAGRSLTAPWS